MVYIICFVLAEIVLYTMNSIEFYYMYMIVYVYIYTDIFGSNNIYENDNCFLFNTYFVLKINNKHILIVLSIIKVARIYIILYLSIYLSIFLSFFLSTYLSIYLDMRKHQGYRREPEGHSFIQLLGVDIFGL